jgi:hypothetical protein
VAAAAAVVAVAVAAAAAVGVVVAAAVVEAGAGAGGLARQWAASQAWEAAVDSLTACGKCVVNHAIG